MKRLREIRASERRFYQKITDSYTTAVDYNSQTQITKDFFKAVQNKLHFAIHGSTAAEVIYNRADSTKKHMGVTTWKNAPNGKIAKSDVSNAKNYLTEKEIKWLDRFVTMYLVFEDIWETIEDDMLDKYFKWLNSIGVQITNHLNSLLGAGNAFGNICEYNAKENDAFAYGGTILKTLFDPFEPYSLIVEDITLACRPRAEIIARSEENVPLRFCLRDTMGLTQIGMDGNSIKDALDIALNCSPDSILLHLNLEERDDVIAESCNAIEDKFFKAAKLDVPVNVIFTKADRIIGNLINKADKDTVVLKQDDYDANILCAISSMEKSIKGYLTKFPQSNVTRYTKSLSATTRLCARCRKPSKRYLHLRLLLILLQRRLVKL